MLQLFPASSFPGPTKRGVLLAQQAGGAPPRRLTLLNTYKSPQSSGLPEMTKDEQGLRGRRTDRFGHNPRCSTPE